MEINRTKVDGYLLRFNERIAKSVFLQSKHTRIMPIKNAIAKKKFKASRKSNR